MAYVFRSMTDGYGHAQNAAAMASGRAAFEASPEYAGDTDPTTGECAVMLHTLPVRVAYEVTFDGADEIAEVTEVLIGGHAIPAQDFAADIRAEWQRECAKKAGLL